MQGGVIEKCAFRCVAGDGFLPRWMLDRDNRLVFGFGISVLSLAAGVLLIVFRANVTHLIPLYAIGVFLSFTLSQVGMVVRWRRTSRLAPGGVAHGSRRTPSTRIGGFIALTKPRIIELLLITTVPTMVLAEKGWPSTSLVLITLLGGTLAAGGANAVNMVVDRDIDALMPRTQGRPLVTGIVSPKEAMVFAIGLEAAAFVVLTVWANLLSAIFALSAMLFYVFIYTLWLKRTSTQNIVIGGAAGAVPVLVGWAAVRHDIAWAPVALFVVMFLWTPPHFWALAIRYADDYRAAQVPMLPAVATPQVTVRKMVT